MCSLRAAAVMIWAIRSSCTHSQSHTHTYTHTHTHTHIHTYTHTHTHNRSHSRWTRRRVLQRRRNWSRFCCRTLFSQVRPASCHRTEPSRKSSALNRKRLSECAIANVQYVRLTVCAIAKRLSECAIVFETDCV